MREIAQLLSQSDLGEVSFEAGKGQRLTLKRQPKFVGVAVPAAPLAENSALAAMVPETGDAPAADATVSEAILIASPCVGVFHAAKDAIEVGSPVKAKQVVGQVESLKVPNDLLAPATGVVAQMWVSNGQGVEWGQPLFEIAPGEAPAHIAGG